MNNCYGIQIYPADIVKSGDIKDIACCNYNSQAYWFNNTVSAIAFADTFLRHKFTPDNPGIAFLYITDKVNQLRQCADIPRCIGIGGTSTEISVDMAYYPPQVSNSKLPQHFAQYLYSPGLYNLAQLVDSNSCQVNIPDTYHPTLASADTVYVHYGSTVFDKDVFCKAQCSMHSLKPENGFWASSKESNNGWYQWCQHTSFCNDNPNCRIEFNLAPDAKIMKIETLDDIAYLVHKYPADFSAMICPLGSYVEHGLPYKAIDYAAMSKDFDGIDYSYTKLGNLLGPWDCDSIVIFNPDVVQCRDIELVPVDPTQVYEQDEYEQDEYDTEDWEL